MAEQATDLFSNVLVAIDDSEISLSAISAVIPSVKAAKGKMSVVFVRHRPVMFDSAGAESANAWELIEESLTEREKDSERDASALLAGQGITSTFVVRDGDPAREILATATEHESSVVVLGAPVHGVVGAILESSVAEYLLHHCTVPLLIIHPRAE